MYKQFIIQSFFILIFWTKIDAKLIVVINWINYNHFALIAYHKKINQVVFALKKIDVFTYETKVFKKRKIIVQIVYSYAS